MQFFFIVLIICLVLFLYRLYHLANDDFVLAKKNIELEEIFNASIIISIISLVFARLVYVIFYPKEVFMSVLGFILFPYFPGLSLVGGLVGGSIALYAYARYKKFPIGRVFDFFSLSFLFILPVGLIGFFILSGEFTIGGLIKLILFTAALVIANIYLYPKASALEIKDGTISILFLIFFSAIMLLTNAIDNPGLNSFINHKENFVLISMLIVGVILLVKQEITTRIPLSNAK
ncbi:hypothetical protein E6Q11_06985 [Candidatus Dojkabacteria bacterium]|uniref:Prolipoprotein diacylglyceryl transferase n=1 Tax=Candidatus Dojkabacteria bacterium TaxID=2099670 RepID=A0A5C7J2J8_9BACT|nr:MAG: hypothetical protein E6Q11_06985 [Candidatus Dojkabacteria bacterium]